MLRYRSTVLALVTAVTALPASGQTLEESYAKTCSGDVRSETCDALRKALLEKLSAIQSANGESAPAVASTAERDQQRLVTWGVLARDAMIGRQLLISQSMSPGDKFSSYVYGATLVEFEWAGEQELEKKTTQLEVTSYSWGYGAKGQPSPIPPQYLSVFEETHSLAAAAGKIDVTQRITAGAAQGTEHKYQVDVAPAENFGKPFYTEFAINGDQHYVEGSYRGEHREVVSGKLVGGQKTPSSYVRVLNVQSLSRAQLDSIIAAEKQKFESTLSAMHQKQRSSDGWLKALIGAGVGLAAAQTYGLDSTQTLGAVMKGIEVTSEGSPLGLAAGNISGDLITGNTSSADTTSGSSQRAAYPTKPNLATGACTGFTEENYRTKALQGGGDSQLYTMCGQAFEYYVMYKRAISQGYSKADANRTYEAHSQSARVASGYTQSHSAD